jgi:thymidylate kinase
LCNRMQLRFHPTQVLNAMANAGERRGVLSMARRRPHFVSFSGVDGSGKSTQIEAALGYLRDAGLKVRVLRFWDDIAVLGRFREGASHTLFRSEKGIGTPEKPVQRRDKNVRSWPMTVARLFLYGLDAVSLAVVVAAASSKDQDFVIMDRYLYDELANLNLQNSINKAYVRMLLKLVPRPDVAFLLDADPAQARARKPEYPVEFVQSNRASYLTLADLARNIDIVESLSIQQVREEVRRRMRAAFAELRAEPRPSPSFP